MNKKALKEFAIYARNELREQIALRAQAFGITPEASPVLVTGADYVEVNGKKYPATYKNSIQKLLKEVETKGYDNVIEEVAYTWFNRLIAIRYMEVHNYLPSKVRVLSSETKGKVDPDILTEYQYTDLPVNKEEVDSLLAQGNREEAFRKLLVAQCNELNGMMDFLFEKLADYTELLLPESLLHADSLINKLGKEVEDENFEHVEVIGWLYQYYIAERKDVVFAGLKKNKKITKEDIPAATQLFTPHWIVRYMVENSLGHMWLESHPASELKEEMKYYVEPAEQELEVQAKLEELRNPNLSPEEITVLDPACGSGHILVYAFDLLYQIYEERGYPTKEIPTLILEKNLYGIDIDDRAAQLASFALMMKAREKTKRIFRNVPKLNVISIQDSNGILKEQAVDLIGETDHEKEELKGLFNTFIGAKNFGSILCPEIANFEKYLYKITKLQKFGEWTLENFEVYEQLGVIEKIIMQAKILCSRYDVVITNPPYMGAKGMNPELSDFTKKHYKDSRIDLYAVFMDRCSSFTKENGFHAEINQHTWMFITSFEKFRTKIINQGSFISMLHLGPRTFEEIGGEVVQSVSYIHRNLLIPNYKGMYHRLVKYKNTNEKEIAFLENRNTYTRSQEMFKIIPGNTICYWINDKVLDTFKDGASIEMYSDFTGSQNKTANNELYTRFHWEVEKNKFGPQRKWVVYAKGGKYRKWFGNLDNVVDWSIEARNYYKNNPTSNLLNPDFWYKEGITYTDLTTKGFNCRYLPEGCIYDMSGPSIVNIKKLNYFLGILNSKVADYFFEIFNPTLHIKVGDVKKLPLIFASSVDQLRVEQLVSQNMKYSENEWSSFETAYAFQKHPFQLDLENGQKLSRCYENWANHTEKHFSQLQQNEEELNKIFIELYGLQEELTPEVPDENVTIRRADRVRDTKSFLSYCIGLMMGRYSLDVEGLAYAGGEWDASKYKTFQPDSDGIIPLTDTEYFEDDVVTRLQELLVIMFGQDTLAENLRWLAESLTMKNNETPVERLRRYFFDEFYSDHCKIYQKRPIYWMADSGKKKGFRALFYLHRYTPETLATMRFSYVQNLQEKLSQEQKRLEQDLVNPDLTAAIKKRYNKQLTTIKAQQDELIDFDKKMAELANGRIALDLDDGVVVNYKKIESVLAKIK